MEFDTLATCLRAASVDHESFFQELAFDINVGLDGMGSTRAHTEEFLELLNHGSGDQMLAFLMGCRNTDLIDLLGETLVNSRTTEDSDESEASEAD